MNMKRLRYGNWYYNSGEEVDEWYEKDQRGTTNFVFCNQCYNKHGNALIMQLLERHSKSYWFDYEDEPIGLLEEWDRPIYPEYLSDEDVAWREKNSPYECQKCDAPIREKRE
jgi:hypothetical protein